MVLDDAAIISFLVIENADEAIRLGHFLNGFTQIPQTVIGIFRRGALKVSRDDLQFFAENSLGDFMHLVHSRMDLFCSASAHRTADKQFFHTEAELDLLWANIDKHPIIDMILIQCYSGWRPGELCDLKMKDVDMDVGTFTGGLKTKAGINRTVPIHPRIYNLVKARYEKALEAGSPYLFFTIRQRGFHHQNTVKGEVTQMRYASFSVQLVNEVVPLLSLNSEHKGHDGRITFVTMAKKYNMDEYAIKRLVGHHIKDLTERVYTQRSIDWLKNEIEKIP